MKVAFAQSSLTAGGTEKIVYVLAWHGADVGDEVHVLAFSGTRENSYFILSTVKNSIFMHEVV